MELRHKALEIAVSQIGVKEVGGNNRGPQVEKYQKADDLTNPDIGYAWCASFVQWCFRQAGQALAMRTASVGHLLGWARLKGYVVDRPFRGDLVCFHFDKNTWPDHIGFVERVLRLGPVMVIRTVEGNTSSDDAGSQDDGGGVYRRTRTVRKSKVEFIRIPGKVPVKKAPAKVVSVVAIKKPKHEPVRTKPNKKPATCACTCGGCVLQTR